MASNDSGGIRQCLTDLMKADTALDYSKALQAANKMIRRYPKEVLGYKGKLIALIQLSLYEDALSFIKQCNPLQLGDCSFEHAYVLYRMGLNEDALQVLENVAHDHFEATEIKAQIFYKLERFQEAHDLYLWLLEETRNDEYAEERRANFLAVKSQLESWGVKQTIDCDLSTFEQWYNAACHKIECRDWKAGLQYLDKAIELCHATLVEEGLTNEELEQELAFLKVQRAYVHQKMGELDDAQKEYRKIQECNCTDVSVLATQLNNSSCFDGEINLTSVKKSLKAALSLDQSKLTTKQKRCLAQNNALMLFCSNQREPCRRVLTDLQSKYGVTRYSKIINAALLIKMGDTASALKILDEDSGIDVIFAKIHISINQGLYADTVEIINDLPSELRHIPAINSLLIACLVALNQSEKALSEIEKNLKTAKSEAQILELLLAASHLEMDRGNNQDAAKYLEKYRELKPMDNAARCKLIKVYSEFCAEKARALIDQVIPESNISEVSAADLEESDWILRGDKYKQRKEAKMDENEAEIITRKLKNNRRKRKIRLPKNYDLSIQPDPERWLPKQERAAYKRKLKKNKDRDIGRGTQGSATANPNVEYTTASPASPRAVPLVAEGPRQQRPTKAQKQKKKKTAKF